MRTVEDDDAKLWNVNDPIIGEKPSINASKSNFNILLAFIVLFICILVSYVCAGYIYLVCS